MNSAVLKKAIIKVIGIAGVAAFSGSLQAASFDCAKASSKIEKMICTDESLSVLDEQLSSAYKTALEAESDKASFKQEQLSWLKTRNACTDTACLIQSYQSRIAVLGGGSITAQEKRASKNSSTVAANIPEKNRIENKKLPLTFKLTEGDSYPLCQPYVDMLNKTKYMEYPACERKLLPEFKQFKSVEWVEITDRKEIEKITSELVNQQQARHGKIGSQSHSDILMQKKDQIAAGESRLYFYNFDFDKDGTNEVIYREVHHSEKSKNFNQCDIVTNHKVFDKKITPENIAKHSIDKYLNLRLGGSDFLFQFDGKVINSYWESYGDQYSIQLWSIDNYQALCKINIQ